MNNFDLSCSLFRFLVLLLTPCCFDTIEAHKDSDLCKFDIYDYDILNGPDHLLKEVIVKNIAKCEKKCCSHKGCDLFNFTESSGKCQLFSCFDEEKDIGTCNTTDKSNSSSLYYRLFLQYENTTSSTRSPG